MTRKLMLPTAAMAILFLAACGSSGDLGDIFGGASSASSDQIRGTVDYVDTSQRFVVLNDVSNYSTRLQDGSTTRGQVRVHYDEKTPVTWQGNTYRPADLERGDEVAVRITRSGDRFHAESMQVLHNAGGTGTGSVSSSIVRGTVQYVDTGRRTIEVNRAGSSGLTTVSYDANTPVDYEGRVFRPADLERGDEIEIRLRNIGGGQLVAERISVIRPVGSTTGTATRTLRGTVSYVDASRRTLELSQTSWISRFNTGGTGTIGTTVLTWDDNTRVEYQGQFYPPTNLERGDIIDVTVTQIGSTYRADRIVVVRDVNVR
jgi:hypothetical protein